MQGEGGRGGMRDPGKRRGNVRSRQVIVFRDFSHLICVCVCVCVCFRIIHYVNCFGRTVLYVCIEYCI